MLSLLNYNIKKLVYRGYDTTQLIAESIHARLCTHETLLNLLEELNKTLTEKLSCLELVRKQTLELRNVYHSTTEVRCVWKGFHAAKKQL